MFKKYIYHGRCRYEIIDDRFNTIITTKDTSIADLIYSFLQEYKSRNLDPTKSLALLFIYIGYWKSDINYTISNVKQYYPELNFTTKYLPCIERYLKRKKLW